MLIPKPVLGPLDTEVRTIPYTGDPLTYVTLSVGQLKRGKYLFSNVCATCHNCRDLPPLSLFLIFNNKKFYYLHSFFLLTIFEDLPKKRRGPFIDFFIFDCYFFSLFILSIT
jgi:hypothetical protein